MGLGDWFKNLLGLDEEDEEEDFDRTVEAVPTSKNPDIASALSKMTVVVISPTSFEEARKAVDSLKIGKPIMANFEETEKDVARRFIDFASGACYALDGMVEKIGRNVFLFATKNIAVSSERLRVWEESSKKPLDSLE
ncbi:MAG TPA: cell division protein SepF [Caldisericia bacterium]|nr:cell division protein SepF [Caldisericia bacterium]HPF48705.1 cell division protein SepF [Caldisericia bacterium]HPI83635.1 cell division protein SepF [Caldisericia bacterium]HPQ93160.1 cell division protein SepF [Caldisericia bacterium]HRV75007.1 cell division protein SepF [Caldisericia bacterium]